MLLGSKYDPQKDPQNAVGLICIDQDGHTFIHLLDGDTSPEAILEEIRKMQESGIWVTGVKEGDIVTPINNFLNQINKNREIPQYGPDLQETKIPKFKPDLSEPDYPDLDF